jgi:hypothetical protein
MQQLVNHATDRVDNLNDLEPAQPLIPDLQELKM